jgi:hypothetical protein
MDFNLYNRYPFRFHLILTAVFWLCGSHTIGAETSKIAEQPSVLKALADWFECIECVDGELQQVLAYGKDVKPLLLEARRSGPTPAVREQYRRHLGTAYRQLSEYAKAHGLDAQLPDKQAYISMYMQSIESRYQGRAAAALEKLSASSATETPASPGRLRLIP